jgi:hypothetical protein
MAKTWLDVALAFVSALPATIAAIAAIRNGRHARKEFKNIREQNGAGGAGAVKKRPKKNGQHPHWYHPKGTPEPDQGEDFLE